jgi:hypothetical protein
MRASNTIATMITAALLCTAGMPQGTPPTAKIDGAKPGILVELFTSEGCSDCPPADELLRQLDAQANNTPHQIVVLGEHVDYWDGQGWHDRFSSHAYTDRQAEYARRLRVDDPYTPQMVVDGRTQFVGNDARRLQASLRNAASEPKTTLSIDVQEINPSEVLVKLEAGALPDGSKHADLYLALADNSDETRVGGGENSGKSLHHVAVLRSLQKVANVNAEGGQKQVKLKLPKSESPANLRLVAFVQESENGPVLGASVKLLGEPTR